jgi:hypothetical protein
VLSNGSQTSMFPRYQENTVIMGNGVFYMARAEAGDHWKLIPCNDSENVTGH